MLSTESNSATNTTDCSQFCFDSFISNPLHIAQRAMAAVVPLPLAGQRRAFLNLFLPRTSSRRHSEASDRTRPSNTTTRDLLALADDRFTVAALDPILITRMGPIGVRVVVGRSEGEVR